MNKRIQTVNISTNIHDERIKVNISRCTFLCLNIHKLKKMDLRNRKLPKLNKFPDIYDA